MANRPCKPDADVKRIWQWLLPDTAFPACGAQASADASEPTVPVNETSATNSNASSGARTRTGKNDE
jgi:hypothetical protein